MPNDFGNIVIDCMIVIGADFVEIMCAQSNLLWFAAKNNEISELFVIQTNIECAWLAHNSWENMQ